MTDKNVKAEHVQFVNELLKNAREALVLDAFNSKRATWSIRGDMLHCVNNATRTKYYDVDFEGPWTVTGLKDWLEVIEAVGNELGIEARIETDYDASMAACWDWQVPYTDEEKQIAQEWLDANPAPEEPELIQFRPMVPFSANVWIDDDVEPF